MSMIDHQDTVRIILSFRVHELKLLLAEFNLNRYGAKSDLQERAVSLLNQPTLYPSVRRKVLELQEARLGSAFDRSSIASVDSNSNDSNFEMSHPTGLLSYFPMPNAAEFVEGIKPAPSTGEDLKTNSTASSMRLSFKSIPFFEKINEIIKPQLLEKCSNMRYQEVPYSFKLSSNQASRVSLTRNVTNPQLNPVQVHVRFNVINSTGDTDDCFPTSLGVKVNNRMVPIPTICPTNKSTTELRKLSRPIDITPFLRLSPLANNTVTISFMADYQPLQFCFTVQLVKRLEATELLDRLVNSGASDPSETRNLVVEKLRGDDESEILSSSLKCKLACPLGKIRIQVPIRGKLCKHIQCFDALLYLKMNEKKSTWICPICDQKAEYHHLFVDGYFNEILSTASNDCDEIEFLPDGNWRRQQRCTKSVSIPLNEPVVKKQKLSCDVITLDSDDENDSSQVCPSQKAPPVSNGVAQPNPNHQDKWLGIFKITQEEEPEVIALD